MGYDRAITVFSPDGRLFQVEYARESVKRGTTTVGLLFDGGVILIVDKRIASRLIKPSSIEKVFEIDAHIGFATSGLVADARVLVDRARIEAQISRITYGEPISIEVMAKRICDFKQSYTQYGGVRPFGTALIIAGVDERGPALYETDPSGAFQSYTAGSIGAGRQQVVDYFEEHFKDNMSEEEAVLLGLTALAESSDSELKKDAVVIGIIRVGQSFAKLSTEEVVSYIEKVEAKLKLEEEAARAAEEKEAAEEEEKKRKESEDDSSDDDSDDSDDSEAESDSSEEEEA